MSDTAGLEPPKRKRGRPPGQKMRTAAEHLRHTHFSFLRAVMQGIDLRKSWQLSLVYEGGPDDERHFAARLRELLSTVRLAAGQRGLHQHAELALAGLDLVAPIPKPTAKPAVAPAAAPLVTAPSSSIPGLDEWVEQRCAELGIDIDFQSQAEWLAEYEEEFNLDQPAARLPATSIPDTTLPSPPPPLSPSRAVALPPLDRRLEALNHLTYELAKPPALTDLLSAWLSEDLARRLASTTVNGRTLPLLTVGNLIAFVNLYHYRWWTHVPRLGEERASRLMEWLTPLARALDNPIKEISRRPLQVLSLQLQESLSKIQDRRRYGIVPLDRLAVPPELDGSRGDFRLEGKNTLGANTDLEAILAWLRRYEGSPRTQVSNARIVERFYLWCINVKRKAMSSLVVGDFFDYSQFMANPPANWVQERRVTREMAEWRPFKGPLSPTSIKLNFSVISAMHVSLRRTGYLRADGSDNVLPSVRLPYMRMNIDRTFTDAQWHWLMTCWKEMYLPVGPKRLLDSDEQQLLPDEAHPDQAFLRAAFLRRTRLALELGSTTGLRLIEFVTTRRGAITHQVIEGEAVWLMKVDGKGKKNREVLVFDDIMDLLTQHHEDMKRAGTAYNAGNPFMRKLRIPNAAASTTTLPSPTDQEADAAPAVALPASVVLPDSNSPSLPGDPPGFDPAKQPLLGALRHAPPRKKLDKLGLLVPDDTAPVNTDNHGSLDPVALHQSLKRFLDHCADRAIASGKKIEEQELRRASAHWLRHFFANSAINDGVNQTALQEMMGHSSLAITSVYTRQNRTRLLDGMKTLRRRG